MPLRGVRKVSTTKHATYPGQDKNCWGRASGAHDLFPIWTYHGRSRDSGTENMDVVEGKGNIIPNVRALGLSFAAENWKRLPGLWGDAFRQGQIAVLVRH